MPANKLQRIQRIKRNMAFSEGTAFYPRRCIFYVTMRCNLRCPMCFQKKQRRKTEELTVEDIRRIFSNIKLSSILLVGGEIFVRPDIYEILELFNSLVDHVSIQTNGTLIQENGIDRLIDYENLRDIWISVDGLEDVHDSIRGDGSFRKILKIIERLRNHKNIFINTVLLRENVQQLVELYRLFDAMGVDEVSFQFQMIYSREQYRRTCETALTKQLGIHMHDDCVLNDHVDLQYIRALEHMIPELIKHRNNARIRFYPDVFADNINDYLNGTILNEHKVICRDIIEPVLKVGSAGELLLCEAMMFSPGNLKSKTLDELWNCSNMKDLRRRMCQANLVELCSRCCCLSLL